VLYAPTSTPMRGKTGERISSLETDVHWLLGNGQPGRLALSERAVERLIQWRWWVIGAAAGGSIVISGLAWIIVEIHK
jgi:hypothetical protein